MFGKMVIFTLGATIVAIAGVITTGLMVAAKMGDKQSNAVEKKTSYRCKTNPFDACGDMCCRYCFGAPECKWACEMDPSECKQAIKVK